MNKRLIFFSQSLFFLLVYGFFIGFAVDPRLIVFKQDSVFLLDAQFFHRLWSFSGGPVEYAAAFLLQFFAHAWAGALILAALAACIVFSFKRLMGSSLPESLSWTGSLIPLLFLAALHSRYDFPLAATLGLVLALCAAVLYQRMLSLKMGFRLPILVLMTALLYYLSAGQYLLFVLLALILEGFHPGRRLREIPCILVPEIAWAIVIPLLFDPAAWVIGPDESFLKWILLPRGGMILPLFCLTIVLLVLISRIASSVRWSGWMSSWPARVAGFFIIALVFTFIMIHSVDVKHRSRLRIRMDAANAQWEALLAEVRRHPDLDALSAFHMHRALYHVGRLGDEMFMYPQERGADGLIPLKEKMLATAIDYSDFWMELGHDNEAEHWAHEAITQEGETPRILRRLAEIALIEDNRAMAKSAIALLGETLFHRKEAERYRKILKDSDALPPSHWISLARANRIDSDFLVHLNLPEMELVSLVKRNPKNHMAYEYLMSYYLLVRQIEWFVRDLDKIREFDYSRLPAHWEEALILYMMRTGRANPVFAGFRIRDESFERFRAYQEILQRFGGNTAAAHPELRRRFGGTYWYYAMYAESNQRPVDGATGATP